MPADASLPAHATVVVVGAGVIGASVAYHLARQGCGDVLLLERSKAGSGTSWHAAGNMETYREDPALGAMIAYGVGFFPELEAESGQALGWRRSGRVMFATSAERAADFRRLPALGRARGIEIELLTPAEVAAKLPIIEPEGLTAGVWIPSDGRVNPTDLVAAFCRGARRRGARLVEDVPVRRLIAENGRITGVETPAGTVACDAVVLAAGLWTADLAATAGIRLPLHATQHFYLLTKPIAGVTSELPLFLSYDERLYGREDVGGLLVGVFDRNAIPVSPADLPADFSFGLLPENWDQIEPDVATAMARFPCLRTAEIRMLLNGPESFTPDTNMLLGEVPGMRGCFLAAGMNSSGIALSPAVGRLTAEWVLQGAPSLDVTHLDVRRFGPAQANRRYIRARVSEVVSHMCRLPTPDLDFTGTRMIRRSPLHDRLAGLGARFTTVLQWERPVWFETGAAGPPAASELAAAETGVALFDLSSDCKLRLEGPDAHALLRRLSGAVTDLPVGHAVLAPMLNERGGVESLPTVARLSETAWLTLAGPEQGTRLPDWIARNRAQHEAAVVDVTSAWCCIGLAGPRAAALLAAASGSEIEIDDTVRPLEIGYASGLLLPWLGPGTVRLLVTTDCAATAFDALWAQQQRFDLRCAGSMAAEALAQKHGVPRFGAEATPFRSPAAPSTGAELTWPAQPR